MFTLIGKFADWLVTDLEEVMASPAHIRLTVAVPRRFGFSLSNQAEASARHPGLRRIVLVAAAAALGLGERLPPAEPSREVEAGPDGNGVGAGRRRGGKINRRPSVERPLARIG